MYSRIFLLVSTLGCTYKTYSLACQTTFRTGRYRLKIISARAEKGLDQFTVLTGTGTFEVSTTSGGVYFTERNGSSIIHGTEVENVAKL